MVNLLPAEEKTIISWEKKKKIVIICWILVLVFFISLTFILSFIRAYLQIQLEAQKNILVESEERLGQSGVKEIQEKINSANLTLTKLESFYKNKTYFSEILGKISQIIPSKLHLSNLSVAASQTKNFSADISLSGLAPTREDLFDFREALEKDSYFQDIYFPPTNWVKPADINFFVTFKIPAK